MKSKARPDSESRLIARQVFFRLILLNGLLATIAGALSWLMGHDYPLSLTGFLGLIMLVLMVWAARSQALPIGRILRQSQALLKADSLAVSAAVSFEEVSTDSHGEWSEIESNLSRVHQDFEKAKRRLERDRIELATVIGSLSDAILAVDPKGVPLFYNSRFAMLFMRNSRPEASTLWDLIREPQILDAYSAALNRAVPSATRTITLDFESEGRRQLALSVSPLKRPDHSVYGAVGTFHDITEMKLAEQMRIDFVANVSHELRTPLTSIKGYSDTLQLDLKSGKAIDPDFMSVISKNVNRLMSLIGDLLDLSSIESQAQSLQFEMLPTSEVTSRVLNQLSERFQSKGHSIRTQFEDPQVYADAGKLEQVLVNLLDNANKYAPPGGWISVNWTADGGDTILTISDSGPGIPAEHQARLFERFYRVDKARSRELGGTGLGLAIVKHILQRHEGSVSVSSPVGQGACFVCRFPKKKN